MKDRSPVRCRHHPPPSAYGQRTPPHRLHIVDVQPVFHAPAGPEDLPPPTGVALLFVPGRGLLTDTARRRGGASCGESPSTATKHRVAAVGPGSTARWWQLTSHVARRSDWCHVATYADIWPSARNDRPGLLRLVGDAGPVFDLVVIDGYQRLALRRRDQRQITQYLAAARAALMVPSSPVGRRLAATLLNVALADLVCESAR